MSVNVYHCPHCGAVQPGPHNFGCAAALQGIFTPPPPAVDANERIARALERIAEIERFLDALAKLTGPLAAGGNYYIPFPTLEVVEDLMRLAQLGLRVEAAPTETIHGLEYNVAGTGEKRAVSQRVALVVLEDSE